MKRKNTFTAMQWKEIKRSVRKTQGKKVDAKGYRRLMALHMRGLGKSNKETGEVLGFAEKYVTQLVAKYKNHGMSAILEDKRTSNNRRMTHEEESKFLEQFVELAETGQIITVEGILRAFEEKTGKESNTTTIYQLLKRHGWRKVKPRPRHPGKASDEEIESSKKLTKNSGNSCWKKIEETNETSTSNITGFGLCSKTKPVSGA
jgi:transposase